MECSFSTPHKARAKAARTCSTTSERAGVASGTPSRGSRLSERRYTFDCDSSLLGEVSVTESVESSENIFEVPFTHHVKGSFGKHRKVPSQPDILPTYLVRHSRPPPPTPPTPQSAVKPLPIRSSSHQRKVSISFTAEASYDQVMKELKVMPQTPSNTADNGKRQRTHVRTASELDSVVYLDPNDSVSSHPHKRSIADSIELGQTLLRRPEKPPRNSKIEDVLRSSIVFLGSMPVTAYCPQCQRETHTQVGFKGDKTFSSGILAALGQFFACCAVPSWLGQMRVHYCTECDQVLARA
jgi:hypothetical protein